MLRLCRKADFLIEVISLKAQKTRYIISKYKMFANSYQHFQQLFQHAKKPGFTSLLSNFFEKCRCRESRLVTKQKRILVDIIMFFNFKSRGTRIGQKIHNLRLLR